MAKNSDTEFVSSTLSQIEYVSLEKGNTDLKRVKVQIRKNTKQIESAMISF